MRPRPISSHCAEPKFSKAPLKILQASANAKIVTAVLIEILTSSRILAPMQSSTIEPPRAVKPLPISANDKSESLASESLMMLIDLASSISAIPVFM